MATFPLGSIFQRIIKLPKLRLNKSYFSLHLCTFLDRIQTRQKANPALADLCSTNSVVEAELYKRQDI